MAGSRKKASGPATIEEARGVLSLRLPALIAAAMAGYEALAKDPPPADAKEAAQYHAACRAALGHLDLLAKLARWVDGSDRMSGPGGPADEDPSSLIARARAALGEGEDPEA
ncbi:MAG: hypothetical protein H7841_09500 [Magnetospirillum sp. WYHS-4]